MENSKRFLLKLKIEHPYNPEIPLQSIYMKKAQCRRIDAFETVLLEKTLESPLDCKEIQPVHSKGEQSWDFFGRNDAKAETPVLWPPHVKS